MVRCKRSTGLFGEVKFEITLDKGTSEMMDLNKFAEFSNDVNRLLAEAQHESLLDHVREKIIVRLKQGLAIQEIITIYGVTEEDVRKTLFSLSAADLIKRADNSDIEFRSNKRNYLDRFAKTQGVGMSMFDLRLLARSLGVGGKTKEDKIVNIKAKLAKKASPKDLAITRKQLGCKVDCPHCNDFEADEAGHRCTHGKTEVVNIINSLKREEQSNKN